jgi:methylenetetrahydrofolate reductase (NADPH)
MRISDLFNGCRDEQRIPFSFEFFPPKTEKGWEVLFEAITNLIPLNPAYVSVTYGAGGSTRDNTHKLVSRLHQRGLTVVAHLTCEGSEKAEIDRILKSYNNEGIQNILALKGDVSKEQHADQPAFAFASDLVTHIRTNFPHFGIGVAGFPEGHPNSRNRLLEMDHFKHKIDAGADYIVTQLFFDNHDFYDYCERCELAGIKVPIIAGIMPVTTQAGMHRMAELAARSRFPAKLLKALGRTTDPLAFEHVGVHWASEQISDLLHHNVAGIHLYTLNNSAATVEICRNLGLTSLRVQA